MTARPWISGRDYTGCFPNAKAERLSGGEMRAKGDALLIYSTMKSTLPKRTTTNLATSIRRLMDFVQSLHFFPC